MEISINTGKNPAHQKRFESHIRASFGFSFAPWLERGLWDERYESYAIIEDGQMLSNICVFKADLIVNGRRVHAHQLGGVSTREHALGRGLSRMLMEHILEKYEGVPVFLAANSSVVDFYPRFGFRGIQTYLPEIEIAIDNQPSAATALKADDPLVQAALKTRGAYSEALDTLNSDSIQMFHLLLNYEDAIYHLPACGAVVIAEQDNDKLFIADVICEKKMPFEAIARELPFSGIRRVEFGFCPDHLSVAPDWKDADMATDPVFILGQWDLPEKFRFPIMSET